MKSFYTIAILLITLFSSSSNAMMLYENESYLYVSVDSLRIISIYKVDDLNGDLVFVKNVSVGGQPGSLTADPLHKYLHAAIRSNNTVSSFRIDEKTGDLTLLGSVNVTWNPVYVSMDRKGRYFFTAHFSDNKTAVYSVAENGSVKSGAVQVLSTATNPHSVLIDKQNKYLFVPCRSGEAVLQFTFDEISGKLTSNSPDKISAPDSTGPRHIVFHPSIAMVYVANEFGRSVTGYKLNLADGALTKIQTLSMQPDNPKDSVIAGNTGGADIHITPIGNFLYATNRGPDTIAGYEIDQKTGLLTFIEHYPTEKMPRSFDIDPSGKFIFVGGQKSGKISSYKIDPSNGKLTYLKSYSVGSNPVWISIVDMNNQSTGGIGSNKEEILSGYSLDQNFPNPFNPDTTINYQLPAPGNVNLKVYDSIGNEVASLINKFQNTGVYTSLFSARSSSLASGVYFYKLIAGNFSSIKKMVLTK